MTPPWPAEPTPDEMRAMAQRLALEYPQPYETVYRMVDEAGGDEALVRVALKSGFSVTAIVDTVRRALG